VGLSGIFFRSFLWIFQEFCVDLSGMFYEEFGVGLSCIKERGFWAKVLMSSPSSHRFHPFARQSSVAPPAPLSKILSDFSFVLSQQQNALQQIHNEVFVLRQEILQLKEACFNLLEQYQVSFCFLQFFLFSDVFSFLGQSLSRQWGRGFKGVSSPGISPRPSKPYRGWRV